MIDRLARLRLFGEEDESGVSGDASVALAPKRTVTAAIGVCVCSRRVEGSRVWQPKTFVGENSEQASGNKRYGAF